MSAPCLCDTCHARSVRAYARSRQRLAALIVCIALAIVIACVLIAPL